MCDGTGILFEEPNPTGSRPRDLIGLYKQHRKPHPPNTQGRARRKHGGEQGHPEEAESHPEEAERRKRKGTETAGSKEEDLGLRCGEANPNPGTGLWGTSGQRPYADSQRQPRSQVGRGRKPGKKEPEEPKKSLEQPKGSVSEETGTAGTLPPGTKNGNPPPRPQQWESTPQTPGMWFCGW